MADATADAVDRSRPVAIEVAGCVRRLVSTLRASELLSERPENEHARPILEAAREIVETIACDLGERVDRQLRAIETFNVVLFGRTFVGKSSLMEALSGGNGAEISRGETNCTKDVNPVSWESCRITDTPGIEGWGPDGAARELEERAEKAVIAADVVLLCFDTLGQLEGEFAKVAAWVAAYDKPAIAVLNCRNPLWRDPQEVPLRSERERHSRDVASHAQRVHEQLTNCRLYRVPVVAVHAQRAVHARAAEPYEGPDPRPLAQLRQEPGWEERLLAWSNLPALENLLIAAIETDAVNLRLGMLLGQVAGALDVADARLTALAEKAHKRAVGLESRIEKLLAILGAPDALGSRAADGVYARLVASIEALEAARGGRLEAPIQGSAQRFAANVITARLSPARTAALARADEVVDEAMAGWQHVPAEQFVERVIDRAEIERSLLEASNQIAEQLRRALQLVAEDESVDLPRIGAVRARVRGKAGRGSRRLGIAVGATAVLTGPFVGVAGDWLGRRMRRWAARRREGAMAAGRADARAAVNRLFDHLQRDLTERVAGNRRRALVTVIAEEVELALLHRRIARWAEDGGRQMREMRGGRLLQRPLKPAAVLREAVTRCEREAGVSGPIGAGQLWLGESWCNDPVGLVATEPEVSDDVQDEPAWVPSRPEITGAVEKQLDSATAVPSPGVGRGWLQSLERLLAHDPNAAALLHDLAALANDPRPRLVLTGDYTAGKSSFLRRLLVDGGEPVPASLVIGPEPETGDVGGYEWQGMTLVDTPGFQSGRSGSADVARAAIPDAAVVICMFSPNLVVGDRGDLDLVLRGDPERGLVAKHDRALFVVNRMDELGGDPRRHPDEFAQLSERKRIELAQQLGATAALEPSGATIDPARILCMASDPFGRVGNGPARASYFDAHRAWDGFAEFRSAFETLRPKLVANGVDTAILHGGLARLGSLVERVERDVADQNDELEKVRREQADVSDWRQEGLAIVADRRSRLERLAVDFIDGLVHSLLHDRDRDRRAALEKRTARWTEDPVLRQLMAEWHRAVQEDGGIWAAAVEAGLDRWTPSRAFVNALPKLARPEAGMPGADSGRRGGAVAARLVGRLLRGKSLVRAAPALRFAGPALQAGFLVRDVLAENKDDEKQRTGIRQLREQAAARATAAADEVLAGIVERCQRLGELEWSLAAEVAERDRELDDTRWRLAVYGALMADARRQLTLGGRGR